MTRRSAGMDLRRRWPSQGAGCALCALAYLALGPLFGSHSTVFADESHRPPPTQSSLTFTTPVESGHPDPDRYSAAEDLGPILPVPEEGLPADNAPPVATLTAVPASSDEPVLAHNGDLATALERHGDLTLRNSTLDGALFTISELWGINIVVGEVRGSVNGVFKDAPLREILDSILLSNGYSYRPVGKSLVVSPLSELGQINPFFESATIPVGAADVDEVVEGARLLSTPQGQVQPIKSARSLFVLDFPDRVAMIRDFVAAIDGASRRGLGGATVGFAQPLDVGYYRTQYIEAKAAEEALQAVLSKDGRVGVMIQEDRLIVSDYAENLKVVAELLKRIDRPRPQVRITALIYDLSLQDIEELGINFGHPEGSDKINANNPENTAFQMDSIMKVPYAPDAAGATFTFMHLSESIDLTAVVLALQNANDARLLADPHIAVLENEEAVFQSVSEIPYQQLTQTEAGGQIGTTAFKTAGITLRVRPKISIDGTIQMRVSPEYSRLTGFTPGDNQPIIDRRAAATTLTITNRQIVVIGGLRQRSDVGDFKAVPFLKDIRWVGKLFRSRETDVRESELVVFIMPEIIGYADRPNDRQQRVVDTVDHRLNQIPQAEGRPAPCIGPPLYAPPIVPDGSILPVPDTADPTAAPTPVNAAAFSVPSSVSASGQRVPATVAQRGPQWTPPGDGAPPPTAAATRAAESPASPDAPAPGLRPHYDARFRATGGVHRAQQRVAEPAAAAQEPPPPEPAEVRKSVWQRLGFF